LRFEIVKDESQTEKVVAGKVELPSLISKRKRHCQVILRNYLLVFFGESIEG